MSLSIADIKVTDVQSFRDVAAALDGTDVARQFGYRIWISADVGRGGWN